MFTHLHVHSEYSFMDGLPSLSLLAKRARALGMTALALTDHGNLYGAIEFYRLARAEGLKAILGCEIYLQREGKTANHSTFHLTLLAMNEEGYRNLLKLVSLANGYRSGDTGPGSPGSWPAGKGDAGQVGEALIGTAGSFSTPPKPGGVHNGSGYLRPTLPLTTTRELADHATGLIALSGCFQGEIPQALIGGEKQRARRLIRWYRAVFEDRFYLEVQDHGLTEEKIGNGYLVELAREEGVPLVATNNVHYLWPREAAAQRLALAIQRQQRNRPANPGTYTLPEYYLKSPQEMEERFLEIPEACTNTLVITERCNLELDLEGLHLPRFLGQDEKEEILFLRQLALQGARVRYPTEPGGCPRRKVERTSSAPLYQEGGSRKGLGQELSGPSPEPVEAVSHQVISSLSTPVDTVSLQEGEVRYRLGDDFPASSLEPAPTVFHLEPEVRQRLDYELDVIERRGLAGYFLIVWDIVRWTREQGIPVGPGRGSAAGSLAAFCLGITDVDPLRYDLYFERFLNPQRRDLPDIDIDFCQRRRPEVLDYLRRRYGQDRVAHIAVINTLGARGAVRAVGKALGIPAGTVDRLAKLFPHLGGKGAIDHALSTIPELQRLPLEQEPVRSLLAGARAMEGRPIHISRHAAGMLITPGPLTEMVPLEVGPEGDVFCQYPMESLEALGLLKMDLLGLRNLTIIDDTLKLLGTSHGEAASQDQKASGQLEISWAPGFPLDDPETYQLLQAGDTIGCFQLESTGMRELLRRLKPQDIEDIVAVLSLYRPGPWDSGAVASFLRRRRGEEPVTFLHPLLEPILRSSYGIILYQEQVMKIAQAMAGFSLGEGDLLRRALAKNDPRQRKTYQERFLKGARETGVGLRVAREMFSALSRFSGYSFNRSHSAAYAHLSYLTAYLKAHYPVEYFTALLSTQMGYYDQGVYVEEAKRRGVTFLPPDINRSGVDFTVEEGPADLAERSGPGLLQEAQRPGRGPKPRGSSSGNVSFSQRAGWLLSPSFSAQAASSICDHNPPAKDTGPRNHHGFIRIGFSSIKGVGPAAIQAILSARTPGPFSSFEEFLRRIDLRAAKKTALRNLIKAGALDSLGPRRALLLFLEEDLRRAREGKDLGDCLQTAVSVLNPTGPAASWFLESWPVELADFSPQEKEALTREVLTINLGSHPLAALRPELERQGVIRNVEVAKKERGARLLIAGRVASARRQATKKGETMLFLLLEDETGLVEVILFPRVYQKEAVRIVPEGIIIVGTRSGEGREAKVITERILPLPDDKKDCPVTGV